MIYSLASVCVSERDNPDFYNFEAGMKLCLAAYNNRIASVFDNANPLKLFVCSQNQVSPAGEVWVPQTGAAARIATMRALAVNVLICGAINHTTKSLLRESGIEVMDWYCGEVQDVLNAWRNDSLASVSILKDPENSE